MSDQPERKQINFTIVPDERPGEPRTYANFCSIAHTPFDFTLTFCEVMPLSEKEVRDAVRSRWLIIYGIAFAVLALGLSYLGERSGEVRGGTGNSAGSRIGGENWNHPSTPLRLRSGSPTLRAGRCTQMNAD